MTVDKTATERFYSLLACHMFLYKNVNFTYARVSIGPFRNLLDRLQVLNSVIYKWLQITKESVDAHHSVASAIAF